MDHPQLAGEDLKIFTAPTRSTVVTDTVFSHFPRGGVDGAAPGGPPCCVGAGISSWIVFLTIVIDAGIWHPTFAPVQLD